jgi:hypothetical protein
VQRADFLSLSPTATLIFALLMDDDAAEVYICSGVVSNTLRDSQVTQKTASEAVRRQQNNTWGVRYAFYLYAHRTNDIKGGLKKK